MEMEPLDLLTLQSDIRRTLEDCFTEAVWVRAEVVSLSVKGGHCYMELCQTGPKGIVAKARAVIWRSKYCVLESFFREAPVFDSCKNKRWGYMKATGCCKD